MYEGGADVASRPSKPQNFNIDDDDVRSGNFHSTLKEQFQNASTIKKINGTGILKNSTPKQQEVSKKEEYQRKYDDYYQDVNNMIFQTGTFNGEEDNADMESRAESHVPQNRHKK